MSICSWWAILETSWTHCSCSRNKWHLRPRRSLYRFILSANDTLFWTRRLCRHSVTFWSKVNLSYLTSLLCELHWPPVDFQVQFKILGIIFKTLNDIASSYVRNCPHIQFDSQQAPGSTVKQCHLKRLRNHAFSLTAPEFRTNIPLIFAWLLPLLYFWEKALKPVFFP